MTTKQNHATLFLQHAIFLGIVISATMYFFIWLGVALHFVKPLSESAYKAVAEEISAYLVKTSTEPPPFIVSEADLAKLTIERLELSPHYFLTFTKSCPMGPHSWFCNDKFYSAEVRYQYADDLRRARLILITNRSATYWSVYKALTLD